MARGHEGPQSRGSPEEGARLWAARQAWREEDVRRQGAHWGPFHTLARLILSHGSVRAAQQAVWTEAPLNLSRSQSSEVGGPRVPDTRAPLTSMGAGRGEAPPCCSCTAKALAASLHCPRLVWTTGEWRGLALAPTQQSGPLPYPWARGGEDGGQPGWGGADELLCGQGISSSL